MNHNYIIMSLLSVGLLALSGCATFPKSRWHRCINNLRVLDAATEQCALEKKLMSGDTASLGDLSKYIKNGIESISCPSGGRYNVGIVGEEPRCSKHGTLTEAMEVLH